MTPEMVMTIAERALVITLLLAAPMLLAALVTDWSSVPSRRRHRSMK